MIGWEALALVLGLSTEQKRNLQRTDAAGHTLAVEQSRFCQLEEMSHHTLKLVVRTQRQHGHKLLPPQPEGRRECLLVLN